METMQIYVVYDHPADYPGDYVVKREIITDGGRIRRDPDYIFITKDYEEVVKKMNSFNLFRMNRAPDDDPAIKETWF